MRQCNSTLFALWPDESERPRRHGRFHKDVGSFVAKRIAWTGWFVPYTDRDVQCICTHLIVLSRAHQLDSPSIINVASCVSRSHSKLGGRGRTDLGHWLNNQSVK